MTENEYSIYVLLCMAGRVEEAMTWRALCNAREREREDD